MSLKDFQVPTRYIMAVMSFFGFVFNYMLRININIAIVAMVNYTAIPRADDSGRGAECGFNVTQEEINPDDDGPYAWTESKQSMITSSFFWGYIITQIPGGRIAEVYGGKWVFGMAIITAGILNIVFPFAAADNPVYLIALRVLMGICEGPTFPAMHALLAKWAPPSERSRIAAIVYAGCQAGTMMGYPIASFITEAWGWEYVFYIMGGTSLIWGLLWILLVFDSPATHPRIDPKELEYLNKEMGYVTDHALPIPYKAILKSVPFWAVLVGDLGNNWGFWMLLTELPIYMKNILNYDLETNGLLSAAPYFAMWMFSLAYGAFSDYLLKKKVLSIKNIRKIATLVAHMTGAVLLVIVSFTGCNDTATIVLLIAAVGFQGAIYTGFLTNHIDIAPNFAGTLYGITNCAAAVPSFVAPLTAGVITDGHQTLSRWRIVFFLSAGFYAAGSIFFAIFADGEVQPWNFEDYQTKDKCKDNQEAKVGSESVEQVKMKEQETNNNGID